jgi:hypothetical protein
LARNANGKPVRGLDRRKKIKKILKMDATFLWGSPSNIPARAKRRKHGSGGKVKRAGK